MSEMILDVKALPEPLSRLIRTDKVRVDESNGIFSLIPMTENQYDCPLRGLAADSKLTVDAFLAMTHDEKEMTL